MATKKSQRIGIWVIAVAMLVGTLGSFLIMVLAPQNQAADQARMKELTEQYQKDQQAYQAKVTAQAAELSSKYYGTFAPNQSRVAAFDAAAVTELAHEDLVVGTEGEAFTDSSSFSAYYIGWTPDGKVFDSSIKGESLKAPIAVKPGGVIEGWTKGAVGMKTGGIRELTIPSSQAYGEAGSGETIPANTPLKFVMFVIPTPEVIAQPELPQELLTMYQRGQY